MTLCIMQTLWADEGAENIIFSSIVMLTSLLQSRETTGDSVLTQQEAALWVVANKWLPKQTWKF